MSSQRTNILVVSLHPAIDVIIDLAEELTTGVQVASSITQLAAGKGANVARTLGQLGHKATLILPADDLFLQQMRAVLPPAIDIKPIAGFPPTRTNVTISQPTKVNHIKSESGALTELHFHLLKDLLSKFLADPCFIVFSGSLPAKSDVVAFQSILELLMEAGFTVVVDSSESALEAAINAKASVVMPNHDELSTWARSSLPSSVSNLEEQCTSIIKAGVGAVILSLGSSGAMAVSSSTGVDQFTTPIVEFPKSDVGAGDALVGGFVASLARGMAFTDAVAFGVACGTASVHNHIPGLVDLSTVSQVAQQITVTSTPPTNVEVHRDGTQ